MEVPDPREVSVEDEPSFVVEEECSKRGKLKLFHAGYAFFVKREYSASRRKFASYNKRLILMTQFLSKMRNLLEFCNFLLSIAKHIKVTKQSDNYAKS